MTHHIHVTVDNLALHGVLLTLYPPPVPTDFLCVMTHTVVLFIQRGETALDRARKFNKHEVVQYLNEVGKYNNISSI